MTTLPPDLEALMPEPAAFCEPDNPLNGNAFAWPGTGRGFMHTTPLFTADQVRAVMLAATERAAKVVPMQPVVLAADGMNRFKSNRIVGALYSEAANHGLDMNGIARGDFCDEDRMQFAQLIGYSVRGYGELSYVTNESYDEAERRAAAIRGDGGGQR